MIKRLPDWEPRLRKFFADNLDRPFRWGSFDCCLMACDAIRAVSGVDVGAPYRGRYRSMLGAFRLGSVQDLAVAVARKHGIPEQNFCDVRPGDVVLAEGPDGPTLGVVSFHKLPLLVSNLGMSYFSWTRAVRSWRVG